MAGSSGMIDGTPAKTGIVCAIDTDGDCFLQAQLRVVGAMGCEAWNKPPDHVAGMFKEGCNKTCEFKKVVAGMLDAKRGQLQPLTQSKSRLVCRHMQCTPQPWHHQCRNLLALLMSATDSLCPQTLYAHRQNSCFMQGMLCPGGLPPPHPQYHPS